MRRAERQIELESALEHDEHPLHDEVELETEEEEAAPTSEKRLKRKSGRRRFGVWRKLPGLRRTFLW